MNLQLNATSPLLFTWAPVTAIKNKYFPGRYAPIAHYVLFAHQYDGGTSSGLSVAVPAHDLIVTLGTWDPSGGTLADQAGTLMHELGHNLGLRHGGNQDANCGCAGSGALVQGTVDGWLDFDHDGSQDSETLTVDLNGNGWAFDSFQPSQNDWTALRYTGSAAGGGVIGDVATAAGMSQIIPPGYMERELEHR